jgi:hypothetical protein
MRYEKPECVLVGKASEVVLGGDPDPIVENMESSIRAGLVGYDA